MVTEQTIDLKGGDYKDIIPANPGFWCQNEDGTQAPVVAWYITIEGDSAVVTPIIGEGEPMDIIERRGSIVVKGKKKKKNKKDPETAE